MPTAAGLGLVAPIPIDELFESILYVRRRLVTNQCSCCVYIGARFVNVAGLHIDVFF